MDKRLKYCSFATVGLIVFYFRSEVKTTINAYLVTLLKPWLQKPLNSSPLAP